MIFRNFFGPSPSVHKGAGHYHKSNMEQLTHSQIFQAAQVNCLYFAIEGHTVKSKGTTVTLLH